MADAAGRLPDNIVYFGRALRRAGVPVGTAQILEALRAVQLVGFTKRQDFHTTLRAMIVTRPEHLLIFDQVFAMFWRDPDFLENMITNLLPVITAPSVEKPMKPAQNRAAEAMAAGGGKPRDLPPQELLELDAQFSHSDVEKLMQKDFEAMNATEIRQAEQAIRSLQLDLPQLAGGVLRRRLGPYGLTGEKRCNRRGAAAVNCSLCRSSGQSPDSSTSWCYVIFLDP